MSASSPEARNQRTLRKLRVTVEANSQSLELLVAICDDRNLQMEMIETYEAALSEKGINTFRTRLDPKQPSLRASLDALVAQEAVLRTGEAAVVTVLNAESLLWVKLDEKKSEQERFFFSLQWQREALRRFNFAVVLWVPDALATRIGQRAPDFWSWRGGVFEFATETRDEVEQRTPVIDSVESVQNDMQREDRENPLSIEELLRQVEKLEENSPESSLLITSYGSLGEAYERQYAYDEALVWYERAFDLAQKKRNLVGQAKSLHSIGNSLRTSGRVAKSINYYQQALERWIEIGDRNGEANSLVRSGNAYQILGEYQRAIEFHQQALRIQREIGDRSGEASSLIGLGNAYRSMGEYQRTIEFYQQSLEIQHKIGDRNGEAKSLNNLGITYKLLEEYQRAIEFHQQSLEIQREIGARNGEATSLFNRSFALARIDQKWEAQQSYIEAKELYEELGLPNWVTRCNREIQELGKQLVVLPKNAPTIGQSKSDSPDWYTKSVPTSQANSQPQQKQANSGVKSSRWLVWFLVGLGIAILIWWLW